MYMICCSATVRYGCGLHNIVCRGLHTLIYISSSSSGVDPRGEPQVQVPRLLQLVIETTQTPAFHKLRSSVFLSKFPSRSSSPTTNRIPSMCTDFTIRSNTLGAFMHFRFQHFCSPVNKIKFVSSKSQSHPLLPSGAHCSCAFGVTSAPAMSS